MKSDLLYNVEVIMVRPGFEKQYIAFFEAINIELLRKYPKYYKGAQLYQDKTIPNSFTLVGAYYNVPGVMQAGLKIEKLVLHQYAQVGNNVVRTTILFFPTAKRIVPKYR